MTRESDCFGVAAVFVEVVELLSESAAERGVAGEEHRDDVGGDVHAACGIDARSEAEGDVSAGDRAGAIELGEVHQRVQAGLRGAAEFTEADGDDDAVFAGEGDTVGDGSDAEELKEGWEGLGAKSFLVFGGLGGGFEQGLREFEGHAGAAEGLGGIGIAGLVGVEDGDGAGESVGIVGQMVVGDDEVEAEGLGVLGFGESAHSGIHTDDEADAGGGGIGKNVLLDAVAFAEAVRDVIAGVGGLVFWGNASVRSEPRVLEENGGNGAVDVVVAVDEDRFGVGKGGLNAGDGGVHAEHEAGIVQMVEGGGEIFGCERRCVDAAGESAELRDGDRNRGFAGEALRGGGITGAHAPFAGGNDPLASRRTIRLCRHRRR